MPLRAVLLQAKASALAALREAKRAPRAPPAFEPANSFAGRRDGCVFKSGDSGLGYYADASQQQAAAPAAAVAASTEPIAPIEASSMYFQVGSDRLSLRFHRLFAFSPLRLFTFSPFHRLVSAGRQRRAFYGRERGG